MAILLIPICFTLVFFCFGVSGITAGKKQLALYTVFIICLAVWSGTELLSAFNAISYTDVLVYWLLIAAAASGYLYRNAEKRKAFTASLCKSADSAYKELNGFEKALLFTLTGLLLIIFIQGAGYPPNNYDSMTYHLARITSWVAHGNVSYYPTDLTRQIYQPPFSEYIILHFNILNRADYFSASVQFCFLIFSLIAVNCITGQLGLNRRMRLFAMIVAATIPEAVLQASSTQNDVVESFFILASFYFMLKVIADGGRRYFVLLGLAAGFSLLTKGTGYVYAFPLLLVFGVVMLARLFKTRNYALIGRSMLAVILLVLINSGYYIRNYRLAHNLLGIDKTEAKIYSNEQMNPALFASVLLKNAALHAELMFVKPVEIGVDSAVHQFHRAIGVDVNNPAVNYRHLTFSLGQDVTFEDSGPNPLHLLLILFAIVTAIVFWKRTRQSPVLLLLIVILLQIALFCAYLKWQPWNSRLHTPVFLLCVPLVAYAFSLTERLSGARYFIAPLLLVFGILVSLHNDSRPVNDKLFGGDRFRQYFTNKPQAYPEYLAIKQQLQKSHYQNIGLIFDVDDWEYPLFADCYSQTIRPIYIAVDNITRNADTTKKQVDCILSTRVNEPYIDYNNRRYYNKDTENVIIHLYE